MKKFTLLFVVLATAMLAHARIWRVNNGVGVSADFNDLPAAITAAAAGDTIHVEASASGYSGFTLAKKLVFIGPGFFFTDATLNPKTQYNTNVANIGSVILNPGSEQSVLSGLVINGGITVNADNIVLERCNCNSYVYLGDGHSCATDTIRQNYLYGMVSQNSSYIVSNVMVYNNIFIGPPAQFSNVNQTSAFFINNLFVNAFSVQSANCTYQNNIFNNNNWGAYLSSNIFFNNIISNNNIPSGNGNQLGVDLNTVMQGWSNGNGYSSDGRYQLKAGSPAIGAGSINGNPVDIGAFGGPAPYVLSGMPAIPSIYAISAPASVNYGTTTINVSISATTVH